MQDHHLYDQWRHEWFGGVHTQAISLLGHHGLAHALQLVAPLPAPTSAQAPVSVDVASSVLTHAIFMSCTLIHSIQTNHVFKS